MANFTKQAIKSSFLKLLNEKPLNRISVRDIVEDCGINRNSFYYHFQDIPALLTEIITDETDRLIAAYPSIGSLDECFAVAFQFAKDNRRAVSHIYHSVNWDIFERSAMKLCGYVVETYLDTAFPDRQLPQEDRQVLVRFLKNQLFGMSVDWICGGMQDEALEELKRALELCRGMPELILRNAKER